MDKYKKLFACLLVAVTLIGDDASAMFRPASGAEEYSVGFPVLRLTNDAASNEPAVAELLPDDCWRHILSFLPFEDMRKLADVRSCVREWMKDLFGVCFSQMNEEDWRALSNFDPTKDEMHDDVPEGLILPMPYLLCGAASKGIDSVWNAVGRIGYYCRSDVPDESFRQLLTGEGMPEGAGGFGVIMVRIGLWGAFVALIDLASSFVKNSYDDTEILGRLSGYQREITEGAKAFLESISDLSIDGLVGEIEGDPLCKLGAALSLCQVCNKDTEEAMMVIRRIAQYLSLRWHLYFGLYRDAREIIEIAMPLSHQYLIDLVSSLCEESDNVEAVRFVVEEIPIDGVTLRDEIYKIRMKRVCEGYDDLLERVKLLRELLACGDERPKVAGYLKGLFGDELAVSELVSQDKVRSCLLLGWYHDAKETLLADRYLAYRHLVGLFYSVCEVSDDVDAIRFLIEDIQVDGKTLRNKISEIRKKRVYGGYSYFTGPVSTLRTFWAHATREGAERPNVTHYLWGLFGDKLEVAELVSEECKVKFGLPKRSRCSIM